MAAKRGDESHEMAAFMRMFMDLVGIFNEDQSLSEDGKIPAAGETAIQIQHVRRQILL